MTEEGLVAREKLLNAQKQKARVRAASRGAVGSEQGLAVACVYDLEERRREAA